MLELDLQQYLLREYPQENARCEWKEYKNLKNSFCGDEKNDVISYVSPIANMEGGYLVLGVKDKALEIVETDISRLTFNGQHANTQSATFKLTEQCTYLSSEGLSIEEFITDALSLWDCISLDAVQKGRTIHDDIAHTGIQDHKAAGSVGCLDHTILYAELAEQSRLLVAGHTGYRNAFLKNRS